jgi:hypothetical protein
MTRNNLPWQFDRDETRMVDPSPQSLGAMAIVIAVGDYAAGATDVTEMRRIATAALECEDRLWDEGRHDLGIAPGLTVADAARHILAGLETAAPSPPTA